MVEDLEANSPSAALLLRKEALALQKRPLFVLFAQAERIAAILDVHYIMRSGGCAVQNRGITLRVNDVIVCHQGRDYLSSTKTAF